MENLFSSFRRSAAAAALTALVAATGVSYADPVPYLQNPVHNTTISVSDGQDSVAAGGSLRYVIRVSQNTSAVLQPMDVTFILPSYAQSVNPDRGGRVVGNRVIWDNVKLSQEEDATFIVQVTLAQSVPLTTQLTAIAQVDGATATDTTTVRSGSAFTSFRISVTDNNETVYPGQKVNYTITVENRSAAPVTTDVSAIASGLGSFNNYSDSPVVAYPTITWKNVTFAAGDIKKFTFSASMPSRVSPYEAARVIAHVGQISATDTTVAKSLHGDPQFMVATKDGITVGRSTSSQGTRRPLFSNTADAEEVVRGGTIRYTLSVQNVLLHPINNAIITVHYDPAQLTPSDLNGGTITSAGTIQWHVPSLMPGQSWTQTYTMVVSKSLPAGAAIQNLATISGTDVGDATVSDRASTSVSDVVSTLPTTGAAFDLLFALLAAPLAVAGAAMQKKLI